MASSQNTEQLMAQLGNFTPEQLSKFTSEQLTILMGAHATGASTAVAVPLVAASEGAALTPEKKAALDAKEALKLHFKEEVKPLLKLLKKKFGENAFCDKACNKLKPGYELEAPEQVKLKTAQARYDELAGLYQGKLDDLKARNKAESQRKAAEKRATEKKNAKQEPRAEKSADDFDSASEVDSEDNSKDCKHGKKRKEPSADDLDSSSDEEDLPEIDKIDYASTTHPETGEPMFTTSIHGIQQILGGLEDALEPVKEAWKKKHMFLQGFLYALPADEDDWSVDKRITVEELTTKSTELFREMQMIKKISKATPHCTVTITGEEADLMQIAHSVAILGTPASKNAKETADAPENDVVYPSKPDAPVSEQEPPKQKDRKSTPKRNAEAMVTGPSKVPKL